MSEVLVFHHAHGLTDGVRAFGKVLTDAGHTVHLPDLYDGRIFDSLDDGVQFGTTTLGSEEILDRGRRAAENLPAELVYIGFSLGVMPAQMLAQTRPGAHGAVLAHACLPTEEFSDSGWPDAVPVQIHGMDGDPYFAEEGDIDAARALVDAADDGELFVYPGKQHLFADPSLPAYDPEAAELFTERVLVFLDLLDGTV